MVELLPTPTESSPKVEIVKDGGTIVSTIGRATFSVPAVAVIVKVLVPTGAVAAAFNVSRADPFGVTELGENAADTPAGKPEIERLVLLLKPFAPLT